jgi:hypothetical protein
VGQEVSVNEAHLKSAEKNVDENLKVLRTIYAVLYVVGFREVLTNIDFGKGVLHALPLTFLVSSSALVLIAIRMFWSVGNIRRHTSYLFERYVAEHQRSDAAALSKNVFRGWPGVIIMLFDVPTLLIQSFLFYMLCKLQPVMLSGEHAYVHVREFLAVFCALLILNAIWLATFKARGSAVAPQTFWLWNNIGFAVLGAAIWLLTASGRCVLPLGNDQGLFWAVTALCLLNSIVDLRVTAWAYFIGPPG